MAEDVDVAALFQRLKEEVRGAGRARGNGLGPVQRLKRVRGQAERSWAVSAERALQVKPGLRGKVARPVKQVLRRLMRWYVEPLAVEQRTFNDAALKLIDGLSERADGLAARVGGTGG